MEIQHDTSAACVPTRPHSEYPGHQTSLPKWPQALFWDLDGILPRSSHQREDCHRCVQTKDLRVAKANCLCLVLCKEG